MADALWPAELTQALILRETEESAPDLVIRTQMDVGPAKVRRRASVAVRHLRGGMRLTAAQLAIFDAWFVETLYGGALSFEFTNPRTGQTRDYRFVERPIYRALGPRNANKTEIWSVSFVLEELPTSELDESQPAPPAPDELDYMLLVPPRVEIEAGEREEELPRPAEDLLDLIDVPEDTTDIQFLVMGSRGEMVDEQTFVFDDPYLIPDFPGAETGGGTGGDGQDPGETNPGEGPSNPPDVPP